MNWISDFVDLSGIDKLDLIHRFSLSTAEVENEIFFKGSDVSGIVVAEIMSVENHPESKKLHLLKVEICAEEASYRLIFSSHINILTIVDMTEHCIDISERSP